jgi:hypothetical protein
MHTFALINMHSGLYLSFTSTKLLIKRVQVSIGLMYSSLWVFSMLGTNLISHNTFSFKGEVRMIFSLFLRGTVGKRKKYWTSMLEIVTPILIKLSWVSLLTVKMMALTCTF